MDRLERLFPGAAVVDGCRPGPGNFVKLRIGDRAPDFTLPDQRGSPVRLADFRGKKSVVLAFYVFANTPT